MNDAAFLMHVLKSAQNVRGYALDQEQRHRTRKTTINVENAETHGLQHETNMASVGSLVDEVVQRQTDVSRAQRLRIRITEDPHDAELVPAFLVVPTNIFIAANRSSPEMR
jgi:hypothetical protein